ncbi:alpha/beta fold hydrolase [Paenibacillus sp. strain BS8-2]
MQREIQIFSSGPHRLEYSVTGKGTPILLFHGGHSGCLEEFGYEALLASGYAIITPSRAGYRQTSPIADLRQACDLYHQLLAHLNLDKVHVVAVSAGGPTGITFCSMFPERIASFTLQCAITKPWLTQEDKEYKIARRMFHPDTEKRTWKLLAWMNNIFPKLTFRMMASSFSKIPYSEVRKRIDEQSTEAFLKMNNRQRSYSGFLIDLEQTQCDYTKELTAIQSRTLIMHSWNDSSVSQAHPEHAKALIPESEVCMLDSWGHLIWIGKHAAEFDDALLSFLARNNNS